MVRRPDSFPVLVDPLINAVEAAIGTTGTKTAGQSLCRVAEESICDVVLKVARTRVTTS